MKLITLRLATGLVLIWSGGMSLSPSASALPPVPTVSENPSLNELEEVLTHPPLDPGSLALVLKELSSRQSAVREHATRLLTLYSDELHHVLRELASESPDPETQGRLHTILAGVDRDSVHRRRLEQELREVYRRDGPTLLAGRIRALDEDPQDRKALLFIRLSDLDDLWPLLKEYTAEQQLRLLLARLHAEPGSMFVAKHLGEHSQALLSSLIPHTYWPVLLEVSRAENGAKRVIWAGKVEGNTATDVIELLTSPSPRTSGTNPAVDNDQAAARSWSKVSHWQEVVYLWRTEEVTPNARVFAYGYKGAVYSSAHKNVEFGLSGIFTWSDLPASVRLPVVRVEPAELQEWAQGTAYAWARPLVPERYRREIVFRPSPYADPVMLGDTPPRPK